MTCHRRPWFLLLSVAAVTCLAASCGGAPAAPSPAEPATLAARLDAAFAAARQEPNLKSLVVARDGAVVREEFFNGGGADTPQDIRSVTKSVLALTVGAALERGCLRSLDQTLADLLGPSVVTDPQKAVITLRQLLTMTSGLDFPEMASYTSGPNIYNMWVDAPDQVAWVLNRPLTAVPGQRFEYGSATIHLASVGLTNACGTSTAAYAQSYVLAPLGIPPRDWETDNQGYNNGGAGLSLSPRDMQAIGDMVLNGGRMQGRQLLPTSWIGEMTRGQVVTGGGMPAPFYGYGWWVGQVSGTDFTMANGWGGQFIVVVPARRLVVTTSADWAALNSSAAMAQWQRIFDIIVWQVVPVVPPATS